MRRFYLIGLSVVACTALLVFAISSTSFVVTAHEGMPEADAEELWAYLTSQDMPYTSYQYWPDPSREGFYQGADPHGAILRTFVNDMAFSVAGNFPGQMPYRSIIVKENYPPDDQENMAALTVMYKVEGYNPEGGDWFWARYAPDGTVDKAGAVEGCINCHRQPGNYDYVLSWDFGLPEPDAEELWAYLTGEDMPYTSYKYWPDPSREGFYETELPHGAFVRTFVNDAAFSVAEDFPGEMPYGSIIVKENYPPGDKENMAALTIMYKVAGYNPEAGDWFWAEYAPDGTVEAAGKVAGCIDCHSQPGAYDYILSWEFGVEAPSRGQTLLEERCTVCHPLAIVTSAKKTAEGWQSTVDRMKAIGAYLNDEDTKTVVEYLAATYGKEEAPPEEEAALEGVALLEERCTVCHTLGRVQNAQKTAEEWQATVDRMKGMGAQLNDQETTALVEYLAATYKP